MGHTERQEGCGREPRTPAAARGWEGARPGDSLTSGPRRTQSPAVWTPPPPKLVGLCSAASGPAHTRPTDIDLDPGSEAMGSHRFSDLDNVCQERGRPGVL